MGVRGRGGTYVQDDRGALGRARAGSGAHLHGHRGVLLGHFFADLLPEHQTGKGEGGGDGAIHDCGRQREPGGCDGGDVERASSRVSQHDPMASSYTASLQPSTFPGGGGRRAWYHSNTRVSLPDGLTEADSATAVRSPWSAVPSATRLASPSRASHGGRGVKRLRSPGAIRCRARPFVVPWRLKASVDRPRWPSAPQRRMAECGMETESPPVPRWRDGGRRYWGGHCGSD